MGSRLACEISESEGMAYVRLSGVIDEDNGLAELVQRISRPTVVIDTADVDRINSCGVRDWVTWLGELDRAGTQPFLVECSPAIMTQVNLVNNFIGSGTIKSFYAPYFCAACNTDKMLLIDVEEALQSQPFRPPTCRCDQCDHTMEFDDIESSYFAFLGTTRTMGMAPEVREAVRRYSKGTDAKLRDRSAATAPPVATSSGTGGSSAASAAFTPTSQSSKSLKNVLGEGGFSFPPAKPYARAGSTPTNRILFLIIGLLVVAIGLLAYVILRAQR